jgi:hypothetical protein
MSLYKSSSGKGSASETWLFTGVKTEWWIAAYRIKAEAMNIPGLFELANFFDMSNTEVTQLDGYRVVNAKFFRIIARFVDPRAPGPTRIVNQFVDRCDGRGAFTALDAAYRPDTTHSKFELSHALANPVREDGEDITAFALRIETLRDEFRRLENNDTLVPDTQLIEAILRGVRGDPVFEVTTDIVQSTEGITLDRAVAMLRAAEDREFSRTSRQSRTVHGVPTSLLAKAKHHSGFKGRCFKCGGRGHRASVCPSETDDEQEHDGEGEEQQDRRRTRRGDPRRQAGAGATGKSCPLHPMGKHDASECHILKDNPHLATALAVAAAQESAAQAAASPAFGQQY